MDATTDGFTGAPLSPGVKLQNVTIKIEFKAMKYDFPKR